MSLRMLAATTLAVLPLAVTVLQPSTLNAQTGTILGRVTAAETMLPLDGVNVAVLGMMRGTATSSDGSYRLQVPAGVHRVSARLLGFAVVEQSVTVPAGATVTVNFDLAKGALLFDEIVVVGSRTARTALESPVPVDVISAAEVRASGQSEINQILATVVPAFNATYHTIGDGTDHVNPASLRGLGPDQVLVLINGKRRHSSALLHVNGTFGRGTVGVDLNAIPTASIERIEVLRDGAAAQYGSDAIAGVINIVLKDQTSSIQINSTAGITGEGDGEQTKTDVNYGFQIGDRGFFNVTGEFTDRERTDRSGTWTGDIFPGIAGTTATDAELAARGLTRQDFTMKTGQSEATLAAAFMNTSVPLSENSEFYAFGGLTHRQGRATGFFRLPDSEARVVPEIHPLGFLPEIHTEIQDRSFSAGVAGSRNGWDVDLGVTHGTNSFQFNIENTNNASLGAASPTTFDAGRLEFGQTTGNLDIVRLIDTQGALRSLSLVLGSEFRIENYEIRAGEAGSWQLGNGGPIAGVDFDTTSSGSPKAAGSQVFPGFQPSNEVNRFRNSIGAYAGLESQITDQVIIDVGGRFENYSDFGSRFIGKLSARFEVAPNFALRGAVSTGFRAPSLHQVWFNNVSTQFVVDAVTGALEPSQVLTANNRSRVAQAFGIPDLEEETSVNFSAGFTARPTPDFSITADFYRITIDDRIVLTSRFTDADPIVASILAPFSTSGVSQAQFFANSVDTKTNGVDVVLAYATVLGDGILNLTGAANFTDTDVRRINIPQGVADQFAGGDLDAVRSTIFNREEQNRLEDALPRQKFNIGARYTVARFAVGARVNYFGSIEYKPTSVANDETFSAKTLLDLDLSYEITGGLRLSAGAVNIFNTFPDEHQLDANRSNERFIFSRRVTQFGMNGGFYFGRVQLNL